MRIDELTRKELTKEVDKQTKDRSDDIGNVTYLGITEDFTLKFRIRSVTSDPPTSYEVKVKLLDMPDVWDDEDLTMREKVRLAISGDIQINCTCPAYKYFGYEYILTQLGADAGKGERRFPKVRNPKLQGIMCKHCYATMTMFPMYWTKIARDLEDGRFLRS